MAGGCQTMHSPAWIEARTLRLPGDTAPVELNAHPRVCMIQCTKSVRLTFPVTVLRFFIQGVDRQPLESIFYTWFHSLSQSALPCYSCTQNRNLDFMGDDIIIRSTMGAQDTIVDLGARDGSSTSTMAKPWLAASTDSRYETDTPPRTARQCAWRMHRWTSGTAYLRITDPDDSCDMNTRKDASKNTGRMQCRQPQSMRREEQYSPQTASSTETPPNPRTPVSTMTIT